MNKLKKEDINLKLAPKGIQMTGEYLGSFFKSDFECSNGHRFFAQVRHVVDGKFGCKSCFIDSTRIDEQEINSRICHRGIKMIGPYRDTKTKTTFECQCGYKWLATPRGIMQGKGCHRCAGSGFNSSVPAWIYVLVFKDFIKIGITNNLNQRLYTHRHRNGEFIVALTKFYQDGNLARIWENHIKQMYGGKFATKKQCPDGYTETFSPDLLNLITESITIEKENKTC